MAPFLKQLEPGATRFRWSDRRPELDARLRELSDALRAGTARTGGVTRALLDPGFRGARLLPLEAAPATAGPLEVKRATDLPRDPTLDARAFGAELQRLAGDVRAVTVAELLITAIEPDGPPTRRRASAPPSATTSSAKERRRTASSTWARGT